MTMKYALVSDIHANLEAFTTVLDVIEKESCDKIICLGDIVGYGANPRECIKLVRDYDMACIAGNHDFACIGKTNINYFNSYAKESTLWTRKVTTETDKEWLNSLPLVDYHEDFTVVHGTLYSPELFDYIQTTYDAYLSLQLLENQVCFLGHSHVPITFFQGEMISYTLHPEITLEVQGHTDSRGSDRHNMRLSDRRANAVRDYLVGQGIESSRLVARGYGETRPLESNRTRAGRAANRRVEFVRTDEAARRYRAEQQAAIP